MHDHDVLIWDYSAGPWSSALSFCGERKALLTLSVCTVERNFRIPIASHIDLNFRAIATGRIRPFDCAAGVHLHSGHVHVDFKCNVANIDQLAVMVAKLHEEFVLTFAKAAFAID